MNSVPLLRILALTLGLFLCVVRAGGRVNQQPEQPPLEPGPPEPIVAPESLPSPPPKTGTLGLEQRADIFMARKAYSDAVDYYERALKQKGRKDPFIWNKLGIAYQQMQNMGAARRAYKQSVRLKRDFAEPWNNHGTTYFLEKRAKKSLKYYRQAIKLNPSNASFHVNLGTTYYTLKKIPEAIEEYRTALSLDPNVLTQHSTMGTTVSAGRGADAKYFFYMAKVFASLGRVDEAVRYLRRAFEDGFDQFRLLDEDPDFQKIAQLPAYVELRNNPPKAIKD